MLHLLTASLASRIAFHFSNKVILSNKVLSFLQSLVHWVSYSLYCKLSYWSQIVYNDQPYIFQIACMTSRRYCHFRVHAFKKLHMYTTIFGMAAMPFLCNGTLFFQGNLPRVLPVIIYKYASCLIPYIVSFLILCGEWSTLVFNQIPTVQCIRRKKKK